MRRYYSSYIFILLLFALHGGWTYGDDRPLVTAQAWLVADSEGRILDGVNTDDQRSIASITKLMTVMVVLDARQSLTEVIPKRLYNRTMTRQDLIDLAIVKSDNPAAKMLCDYYVGGYRACVEAMNIKAMLLGMNHTNFSDPTGRMHDNVSTATDLIKLVMEASHYPVIVESSNKQFVSYTVSNKKNTRSIRFNNTNNLVGRGIDFVVTKTGFIQKAGGCIVFMLNTERGLRTVVLLGSKNTRTRIPEAYLISTLY